MDRKVIYNGRVSKLDRPAGIRPSDFRKMLLKAWKEHAASVDPGMDLPNLDLNISPKNGLMEVHSKNGEILFLFDPSTGQVSKPEEKDKDLVAG